MRVFFLSTLMMISLATPVYAKMKKILSDAVFAYVEPDVKKYHSGDKVFFGDFNGDGLNDALVFVYYWPGGNATFVEAVLVEFRDGAYKAIARKDVEGDNPRDVVFKKGEVSFITMTQGPNDPRCCPTLVKRWKVSVPREAMVSSPPQSAAAKVSDEKSGPLGSRWCSSDRAQGVHFSGGSLQVDNGGDSTTFSNVVLVECNGAVCTYKHKSVPIRWVVTTTATGIDFMGPVNTAGDPIRMTLRKCQ